MSIDAIKNRRLQLLSIIIFGCISLVAGSAFILGLLSLSDALIESASIVTFNSGTFKLLGIAIGLGALAVYSGIQWSSKRIPSEKASRLITGVLVVAIALLFLLPHAVHIAVERHLFAQGYKLCEPKSRNALSHKTVVYVRDVPACLDGLKSFPSKDL